LTKRLPCYHCGQEKPVLFSYKPGHYTLKCLNCGTMSKTDAPTKKEAIELWNEEAKANEGDDEEEYVALPCPYCYNVYPEITSALEKNTLYKVVCTKCMASGPYKKTQRDAIDWWNSIAALVEPWDD
jgi:transcription elongation factor Elf1